MKNKQIDVLYAYFFVVMSMTNCIHASLQSHSMKLQENIPLGLNSKEKENIIIEEEIFNYSDAAFQSFVRCWGYKQTEILREDKEENLLQDFYQLLPEDIQNTPWAQRCVKPNQDTLVDYQSLSSQQSMSSITDEIFSECDDAQSIDTFMQDHDVIAQQHILNKSIQCNMKDLEMQDCMKTPVVCAKKNNKDHEQIQLQVEQAAKKSAKKAKEKLRQDAKNARRKAAKLQEQEKQDTEKLFLAEIACVVALESKIRNLDQKYMHEKQSESKNILHSDKKIASSSVKLDLEASIEDLLFTMIEDLVIEKGGYNAWNDENFLDQYNELYTLLQKFKLFDHHINSSISLYLETLDKKIKKGMQHFDNDDFGLDYDFFYDNNKKFTIIKNLLKITKKS